MKSMREQAIERFIMVDRLHKTVFDTVAAQLGMHRSQHMVLMRLAHMSTPPNQTRLASELGISPPAMTVMLSKLEEQGYIKRCQASGDRRSIVITLTEKGQGVLERTHELFGRIDSDMFEGMDDVMLADIVRLMAVMEENLKTILEAKREEKH